MNSPTYTVASESYILEESNACKRQLDIFKIAVDNKILWSLKMLDSSGQPKPGFIYGNNFWLGSETQCNDLSNRKDFDISPGNIKNNSIYRNINEEYPPFKVNYFAAQFRHNSTIQYHMGLPNDDIMIMGLCLPDICTTKELSELITKIFKDRLLAVNNLYNADYELLNVKNLKDNYDYLFKWNNITVIVIIMLTVVMMIVGTVYDVTVYQKILENSVHVIHGLKFFAMFWIIMNHTVLFAKDYIGLLSPSYFMSMAILPMIYSHFDNTSVFYMSERPQDTCDKYLWRNFLFINNLFTRNESCATWSWYVSNDMQFYLIGTILIVSSVTYFYICSAVWIILMAMTIFASGYISYMIEYTPTMDIQWATQDYLYDPPWMRIGPYLIGIAAGYIFAKIQRKWKANKIKVWIVWMLALLAIVGTLFSLHDKKLSVLYLAFYNGFSRSVYGIGIALIIIACETGHGGFLNSILSCKFLLPLSRLTYCAYLLNPMIINVIYLGNESSVHMNFLLNFITFLGILITSFIGAFVLSVMFEIPYISIFK
ncbi:nose resistant to fluoxetine protein 6-like, partial [Aphidius gifuensis]|uniref:nose resistant to fluoxetine protein 6-like n=1 Tax=Aphidius gifuensis TaxID=684658 RepID=UPI001CDCEBE8